MAENYEDIHADCTECGARVFLRKVDNKLVCSAGLSSGEYIPLNERCFERKEVLS